MPISTILELRNNPVAVVTIYGDNPQKLRQLIAQSNKPLECLEDLIEKLTKTIFTNPDVHHAEKIDAVLFHLLVEFANRVTPTQLNQWMNRRMIPSDTTFKEILRARIGDRARALANLGECPAEALAPLLAIVKSPLLLASLEFAGAKEKGNFLQALIKLRNSRIDIAILQNPELWASIENQPIPSAYFFARKMLKKEQQDNVVQFLAGQQVVCDSTAVVIATDNRLWDQINPHSWRTWWKKLYNDTIGKLWGEKYLVFTAAELMQRSRIFTQRLAGNVESIKENLETLSSWDAASLAAAANGSDVADNQSQASSRLSVASTTSAAMSLLSIQHDASSTTSSRLEVASASISLRVERGDVETESRLSVRSENSVESRLSFTESATKAAP